MTPIRILVVDDHELIRVYMCRLLTAEPDLEVVGQATTGYEAIHLAEKQQPDVVLLDISMPELNGLMATPLIKKVAPRVEILIVTSHDNLFFVREALTAGARGFLSKKDIPNELVGAVKQVHSKKKFVSKNLDGTTLDATA